METRQTKLFPITFSIKLFGNWQDDGSPIFAPVFEMSLMVQGISIPPNVRMIAIQLVSLRAARSIEAGTSDDI